MKTRELIARLNAVDPSGELEVVVGGEDIYFLERLPFYYDGRPTLLIRDPSRRPYWDVIGVRQPQSGEKVKIHTLTVEDVMWDHPEAIVEGPPAFKDRCAEVADMGRAALGKREGG